MTKISCRTLLDRANEQVQLQSSRHELRCGLRGAGWLVGWLVDRQDEVVDDGGGGDSCDDGAVLLEVGISYQRFEAKSIKVAQQAN